MNVADSPSACLITSDGRAIATSERHHAVPVMHDRLTPSGPQGRTPSQAIAACLDGLGIRLDELDLIVVCGEQVRARGSQLQVGGDPLSLRWPAHCEVHAIDAHLAHACSAFYPSGFDNAAILVVDRSRRRPGPRGVRASAFRAAGGPPQPIFAFENRDDAPEVEVRSIREIAELFSYVTGRFDVAGLMDLATRGGDRTKRPHDDREPRQRAPDLWAQQLAMPISPSDPACVDAAWGASDVLQRAALQLAIQLVERTGARKLCIAGEAAVQGLARVDPRGNSWVDQLYVPPAPGDAGTAVGAALFGCCAIAGATPPCELETAFHGRVYSDAEVVAALDALAIPAQRIPRRRSEHVLSRVAELLQDGALVAWFDGGAELGEPFDRRCVLASPSRLMLAPRLDAGLVRPSFRALTAVVLVDDAEDYFDMTGPSPFAHRVARALPERTREIPLVVRSDGTSRVLTVDAWRAPRLYDLIRRLQRRGAPPVLAAAPLRRTGGRSAETPRDALQLWERAAFDAIYLQGHLVIRRTERSGSSDDES